MRTITINVKYSVGDNVWVMLDNSPQRCEITKVIIIGGEEDKHGATSDLGNVYYHLDYRDYSYTEDELCDTFEELRKKVFNPKLKERYNG